MAKLAAKKPVKVKKKPAARKRKKVGDPPPPCNCNPCGGSFDNLVVLCVGGQLFPLGKPNADATLKFDHSTGAVFWATL